METSHMAHPSLPQLDLFDPDAELSVIGVSRRLVVGETGDHVVTRDALVRP